MEKYTKKVLLNNDGLEIIKNFKDYQILKEQGISLVNLVIESLEKKYKINLKDFFNGTEDDLIDYLLKNKKTTESDYSKSILEFTRKYFDPNLFVTFIASDDELKINKKIGLNKTSFQKLYPVNDIKYRILKEDNFITHYVDIEIREFVKKHMSDFKMNNIKFNISEVYINKNYFDFDIDIKINADKLNENILKILSQKIMYLETELKNKYGI